MCEAVPAGLSTFGKNVLLCIGRVSQAIAQSCFWGCEESPGSTGQGCRITSGAGDRRESATETHRLSPYPGSVNGGKAGKHC